MTTPKTSIIDWVTDGLDIGVGVDDSGTPRLLYLEPHGQKERQYASEFFKDASLPLNGVRSAGEGNTSVKTGKTLIGSYLSARAKYTEHKIGRTGSAQTLDIVSVDSSTRIQITHHLAVYENIPVVRSWATVLNTGSSPVVINQLSSLTIGALTASSRDWWADYTLLTARNSWFREAQWREHSLSDAGIDEDGLYPLNDGHQASQANFSISSRGSFSTGSFLPMGALKHKNNKETWLWQVEHNGSWRWEIGDFQDSIYLAAGGPTRTDHDWSLQLAPGESFTSVTVACCHVSDSVDVAFGALTEYRRKIRRTHEDYDNMPIIFNDYMNCLMGDPTEDKIKALLKPVANSGAEFFVIDAGWYADDSNWWDDVGLWEPSKKRFPSGFKALLDSIRASGLVPGVWLEPEVVGVRSVVGKELPEEAFFQDAGKRILERGRFQLDYRQAVVRERMHGVVDRLVNGYGVGYFKFDYNIEVLSGSDLGTKNSGVAHLDHQRAYLAWVSELLDKYPKLVIENCSSGAQRMDYAMLAVHTLQSTSDQQDPALYAAIAAAVPTAVVPEQSATWAYPQTEWSDETNALTVINSLLGRIHLSGRLDTLQPHQYDLICDGMRVYKEIRHELKTAKPFWPLGFPKWHDDWLALGMITVSGAILLSIWRRGGATEISVPLPTVTATQGSSVRVLYPSAFETTCKFENHMLKIGLPNTTCARLLRIG